MEFIEKITSQEIPEWVDFYIDIVKLYQISQSMESLFPEDISSIIAQNNNEEKSAEINNNVPFGSLNENLLANDEQHQHENRSFGGIRRKKSINEVCFVYNESYIKYLKQVNLEMEKFSYFVNTVHIKRHKKRFDEILQQLNYLIINPALKIFEKQLNKSLKNLYRDVNTFQKFIDVNNTIKKTLINQFQINVDKYKQYYPKRSQNREHIKKFDEVNEIIKIANENNQNLLKEIEEKFAFYFSIIYKKERKNPITVLNDYLAPDKAIQDREKHKKLIILVIIMSILGLSCIISYLFSDLDMDKDPEFKSLFPIFRTFFIICLYLWTLGINVWVWNKAKVNYKSLFMFDNHYSTVIEIFLRSSIFSIIFFSTFFLYILTRTSLGNLFNYNRNFLIGILPLICWLSLLIYFFCPFKMFNHSGRIYTMKLFAECMAAAFIPVQFKHIWFMDQLTSLIGPMRDMEHALCYYSNYFNPFKVRDLFCHNNRIIYLILAIFPNFFRCLQVGRQIYDTSNATPYIFNIGKYLFNIIVATFSFLTNFDKRFFLFWVIFASISGCYSSYWDIIMDFGYFEKNSDNWPLRKMTLYKNKNLCIIAIPLDIILRFLWMLSISPEIMNEIIWPEFLAFILFTLEMFRRALWNFIRVEYENLELIKGHKVSFYEELPLIKCSDGRFVTNEHNLIKILNIEKLDKIRLELRELFNELEKNDLDKTRDKTSSAEHLKDKKKYEEYIVFLLDDFLVKYKLASDEIVVRM